MTCFIVDINTYHFFFFLIAVLVNLTLQRCQSQLYVQDIVWPCGSDMILSFINRFENQSVKPDSSQNFPPTIIVFFDTVKNHTKLKPYTDLRHAVSKSRDTICQ